MNATSSARTADPRLPTVVTVGRHRIGRTLERLASMVEGQLNLRHVGEAFDDAVRAVRELRKRLPIDVLVAAGASGDWLREHVDIPVVMVEVRGFDLLHALAQARKLAQAAPARRGAKAPRIGLVSYASPSPQAQEFEALFGIGISQFVYQGADDAPACVQAMRKAGVAAVVAPGLVADLAEGAGLPSVLLYSDDAVRKAYAEALLLARHRHAERARHQRLETVLQQLQDGVVTVDLQGRIQALNPTMAGLLGAPAASLHGRPLEQFAPQLAVVRALSTGQGGGVRDSDGGSEDVVQIAGRTLAVRRAPIVENGELTGALFACSDPVVIQRADRHLRASTRQQHVGARWRIEDYAGDSAAARRVRLLAGQFAASDATVLIQGSSGTGKELLAQGIHRASRRAAQPFLAVNCAALGESLLESELFGYEEGAFTGARRGGKTGLVEAAHTGTLFLDEIGDMPLALQSRLLRVLQEREVLRVGSTTPVPVDIRVIAATHADLALQVERGAFRRDLFYRLAVLRLATPTLRERGAGDVAALAQAMLAGRLDVQGVRGVGRRKAQDASLAVLLAALHARTASYAWPGNIRELGNWVERLAACRDYLVQGGVVDQDRWLEIFPECAPSAQANEPQPPGQPVHLKDARRQAERERMREVLASVQGNQREACEILGISRATLWRRMKAQG